MTSWKDHTWLHAMVVLLGLTAILGKLITVSTVPLILYRTLIATSFFALIILFRKTPLPVGREWLPVLAVGAILGVHWFCFFGSARMSTVSLSLVTFSTTSFFTSILEPLTHKRRISYRELFLGLLVVCGMAIIFRFESAYLPAILVGLLGAFLSSVYAVANSHLVKKYTSLVLNFGQLAGAMLVCVLVLVLLSAVFRDTSLKYLPEAADYLYLAVLGLLCTVLPYLKIVDLLRKFTAFTINLSVNMEPIYGIFMAWVIFGEAEQMSFQFYTGAILILLSLVLNAAWTRKKPSQKTEKALV